MCKIKNADIECLNDRSTAFPFVVKAITSLISIINPETIILTVSLLVENMIEEIIKNCEEWVPKEHMPHLVFKSSIYKYYLKGLMIIAIKILSFQLKIVANSY